MTRTRTLAHISSDSDSDWNISITNLIGVHTCLLIPEILRHIFSDIYLSGTEGGLQYYWGRGSVQPERGVARRSLVALSCVCRSFKDVALDILWAELENLEPLFTSLPRGLWTLTECQQHVVRRPVTMNDWAIFRQYASRVRVLGNTRSDLFGGVNTEFVHAIMAFSSNSQLMPNLRALCCGFCPPVRHPCMRYLLGPSLVYIRLTSNTDKFWTNIMSSLISGLGRHSLRLEVVALGGMSPGVAELALCEPGLPHLRRVSLTSLTNKTLLCLSRLVGLEKLDITIPEDLEAVKLQFRTTLRRLVIRISTLTSSQDLAEGWVVPCKHLELSPDITESAFDIEHTLRGMNDRLLCNCLRSIHLHGPKSRDHVDYAFSLRTFTPLLQFSRLKSINLATSYMSLLTDDALGSVVKSWPCLEELYLGNISGGHDPRSLLRALCLSSRLAPISGSLV
ncbi:hypothetical protein M405DRAFT_929297 [Rhizopogon salebrosus TDB-379]|nr:hypothetical protein M405DRAFT_929297 [Rhizopogon salebrosus TDB-379]